ncbi:MAG: hypothetical protein ACYTXY_06435 [Nostoc sp.]
MKPETVISGKKLYLYVDAISFDIKAAVSPLSSRQITPFNFRKEYLDPDSGFD